MVFTTIEWIILGGIFGFFLLSSGIVTFILLQKQRWNFSYVEAENLSGSGWTITRRGKARLVKFGDGGEEIFLLKKRNKYRPAYGKRIGKNQILWMIGSDGYAYNVDFPDFDKILMKVGVMPIERDARLATSSLRKGIENRYDRKTFMEKYGTIIAFSMLFICILAMCGFLWIGFNGQKAIVSATADSVETSKEVMELAKEVLANIDNIKYGGSGIVPASSSGLIQVTA